MTWIRDMEVNLRSSFSLQSEFLKWQGRGEMTDTLLVTNGGSVAVHSLVLMSGDKAEIWTKILGPSHSQDLPIVVVLPDYELHQVVAGVANVYGCKHMDDVAISFHDEKNNKISDYSEMAPFQMNFDQFFNFSKSLINEPGTPPLVICESDITRFDNVDEFEEEMDSRSFPKNESSRAIRDSSPNQCLDLEEDGQSESTECKYCSKSFSKLMHLKRHLKTHKLKKKQFSCNHCTKVLIDLVAFENHQLKHIQNKVQSFACDQCPKIFKLFCHLNTHKRTHSGEKPYHCNVCEKRFSESGSMKKHKMRHSGEKPFKCETCSKAFSTKGDLYVHKRIHNRDPGEKPIKRFLCDICSKSFSQVNNLTVHKRIHSGEKPYSCEHCQKTFTQSNDLKTHRRTHSKEKPYQCNLCTMRFSTKANMKRHILVHTGEKPYICDQCPKAFNQQDSLKKHRLRHFQIEVCQSDINLLDCIPEFIENQVKVIQEAQFKDLKSLN